MELTNHQMIALQEIVNWLDNWDLKEKPYWILVGYAGTGKTVLIAELVDNLKQYQQLEDSKDKRTVAVATLTWKAANVLKQKGISSAQSIHSLIYNAERNDVTKEWIFTRKSKATLQSEYNLIIIDEASMVDRAMREDLATYQIPILFVGDSFQLPSISKDTEDINFLANPDSQLSEILRQAQNNPIIQLSMAIRQGHSRFANGTNYNNKVFIFDKKSVLDKWLLSADIVIVGYNRTRILINNRIRQLKGHNPNNYPAKDENLIAFSSCKESKIFNGQSFISNKDYSDLKLTPNQIKVLSIKSEDDDHITSHLIRTIFVDNKTPEYKIPFRLKGEKELLQLAFSYAITTHRSQGSQFNKCIVFNEAFGANEEEKLRWLYTSVTRAVDKLILLQ